MQQHHPVVALVVASACVLLLPALLVAHSRASDAAASGPQASPTTAPSATPATGERELDRAWTPAGIGRQVPWQISQAIQSLGLGTYPNLYEQGELKPDGPMVLYLGPGSDAAFLRDLQALLATPALKALGPTPLITIERVPVSPADFTAARIAFIDALPRLKAAGYAWTSSQPNFHSVTYDVAFSAVPQGMTAAAATAYLRATVSPLIRVTAVDAPPVEP